LFLGRRVIAPQAIFGKTNEHPQHDGGANDNRNVHQGWEDVENRSHDQDVQQ